MSALPPDDIARDDEHVLTFTVDQLRDQLNTLHCDNLTIFVQAWRINRSHPHCATCVCSIFAHTSAFVSGQILQQPRIILGRDPTDPARLKVNLLTVPDGSVESWSAADVCLQAMEIEMRAVVPWIPKAATYRMIHRRRITSDKLDVKACRLQ